MICNWFFPLLGGGEEQGLNDAGIETFKKSTSLGRETIQNIGDARSTAATEAGEPAIAQFEMLKMPVNELPGHEQLRLIFEKCREFTCERFASENDRRANGLSDFDRAIELLRGTSISVLRIRDRNTTGLVGGDGPDDKNTPWARLIRGQGYSSSEGVGGGTYGIGQRAPFAFSDLRTIVYYTRCGPSEEAFIAKAILCTFEHPESGKLTQRQGWFCQRAGNEEVLWNGLREPALIPSTFRREDPKDVGTDLYILGFKSGARSWRQELRRSVLRHFFAAIDDGALQVEIIENAEREVISRETILDAVTQEAGS